MAKQKQKLWKNREEMLKDFALFDREEFEAAMKWHEKLDKPLLTLDDLEMIRASIERREALINQMIEAVRADDDQEILRTARQLADFSQKRATRKGGA